MGPTGSAHRHRTHGPESPGRAKGMFIMVVQKTPAATCVSINDEIVQSIPSGKRRKHAVHGRILVFAVVRSAEADMRAGAASGG